MREMTNSIRFSAPAWLYRLVLSILFAVGALIALVFTVRSTALAQGALLGAESQEPLMQPQDSGVDFSITKTHDSRFFVGEVGTYTIFVKNVGNPISPPYTVTVTDTLPSVFQYVGMKGSGWNCSNPSNSDTVICTFALTQTVNQNDLLPQLKIAVKLEQKPSNSQKVINRVTISDTVVSNNIFTDTTAITTNLSITKTVIPITTTPNNVITFTLTVKNLGPNDATGVKVTDTLPSALTLNGSKPTGQYVNGVWSIGNLAKDETRQLVITATIKTDACGGEWENTARGLMSDLVDPDLSNNTSTVKFNIQNTCVIGKVKRPSGVPIGGASVRLTDSSSHQYTISADASGNFTFTNSTSQPIAAGNATLFASKTGYRSNSVSFVIPANNRVSQDIILQPIAELSLLKSDNNTHIVPSETITYTVPIINDGTISATNIIISDVLDSQLTFLTYTLRDAAGKLSPSWVSNNRTYTWTLGNTFALTPTGRLTLSIRVRVNDPLSSGTNQIDNVIRVRYNEDATTRANKQATDISFTPNLAIQQSSVSPTEAKINERFTFSFRIYNYHPQVSATNVVFTNTFPSYLSFYSSSPSGSYSSSSRVFSVDLGTISPNSFKDVTIIMTVNNVASSTQTLNNTGTLRFEHGGKKQWRSSNTVQYRILGSSTLPGTGFGPPAQAIKNLSLFPSPLGRGVRGEGYSLLFSHSPLGRGVRGEGTIARADHIPLLFHQTPLAQSLLDLPTAFWVALGIAVLLLGAGFLGIAFSLGNRASDWAAWARQMGIAVSLASLFFFGAAWWLKNSFTLPQTAGTDEIPTLTNTIPPQPPQVAFPPPEWWDAQPDRLPDYPVPTPTLTSDQKASEVDDTPPTRLLIPKLGLDAIVKYVPFDGFTWLISGLQNEIAWMGSTSWPGLGSNTALAGHVTLRNGADGPFRYLDTLRKGDEIRLYTEKGVYLYRVQESLVVKDDDFSVVQPTQEAMLTLITCTGWNNDLGHYLERLVVHATLEKSQTIGGVMPWGVPFLGYGGLGGY
mgnify:CR=1 FL=1